MPFPVHIAVASDLHVGRKARALDLCPPTFNSTALENNYLARFKSFVDSEELKPHYLFVPGDVTDRAHPEEVRLAKEALTRITGDLGLHTDQLFVVPGNHEVDWSVFQRYDPPSLQFSHNQKYAPLKWTEENFYKHMGGSTQHLCEEPFFDLTETEAFLLLRVNTSYLDEPSTYPHHGSISQDMIAKIELGLQGTNLEPAKARICLLHHHPITYSDPLPEEPDFSQLTNAESFLRVLMANRFDLVVHGHRHSPRFRTIVEANQHPLAILCAGSFSATLDPRWAGIVLNQFHLIEIDGRDDQIRAIRGRVKSWAYTSNSGWIPGNRSFGIPHISPFGLNTLRNVVESALFATLKEHFQAETFLDWEDLLRMYADLDYYETETILEILKAYDDELQVIGEPPNAIVRRARSID